MFLFRSSLFVFCLIYIIDGLGFYSLGDVVLALGCFGKS